MRIALLTYSTKPRGGVVHTLALAEALAGLGRRRHRVDAGPRRRRGVLPAGRPARCGWPSCRSRTSPGEAVGERILRSIAVLRDGVRPRPRYDVVHAQDCISANAVGRCVRTVHHLDHFTTPELAACHERAIVEPYAHVCVSASVAAEVAAGWGIEADRHPERRRLRPVRVGRAAMRAGETARPVRAGGGRHRAAQGHRSTCWRRTRCCARRRTSGWSSPAARRCSTTATTGPRWDDARRRAGRRAGRARAGARTTSCPSLVAAAGGVRVPVHEGGLRAGRDGGAGRRRAGGHPRPAGAARGVRRRGPVRRRPRRFRPTHCSPRWARTLRRRVASWRDGTPGGRRRSATSRCTDGCRAGIRRTLLAACPHA